MSSQGRSPRLGQEAWPTETPGKYSPSGMGCDEAQLQPIMSVLHPNTSDRTGGLLGIDLDGGERQDDECPKQRRFIFYQPVVKRGRRDLLI